MGMPFIFTLEKPVDKGRGGEGECRRPSIVDGFLFFPYLED
jgi:hypothetical protein